MGKIIKIFFLIMIFNSISNSVSIGGNGVDGYILINKPAAYEISIAKPFVLEFWYKDHDDDGLKAIISFDDNALGNYWVFVRQFHTAGNMEWYCVDNNNNKQIYIQWSVRPPKNKWAHIRLMNDGNMVSGCLRLFIDNIEIPQASFTKDAGFVPPTNVKGCLFTLLAAPVVLGGAYSRSCIDEIRCWSITMSTTTLYSSYENIRIREAFQSLDFSISISETIGGCAHNYIGSSFNSYKWNGAIISTNTCPAVYDYQSEIK